MNRQARERAHFNEIITSGDRLRTEKYYETARTSRRFYDEQLFRECKGMRALEIGTGTGTYAFRLAESGADVIAFDVSDAAVSLAAEHGRKKSVPLGLRFAVMDAHRMGFPDDTFDLVCGGGVLHHVELGRAFAEVARVLKPGGRAIFIEPLGHNPLINAYRRLTPALRTADERPLSIADLERAEEFFSRVHVRFFHLMSLVAVAFRPFPIYESVLAALERADAWVLSRWPWARKGAWISVLLCEDPRPSVGPVTPP